MQVPKHESVAGKQGAAVERAAPVRDGKAKRPSSPEIVKSGGSAGQEALQQTRSNIAARLNQYLKDSGRDVEFRVDAAANTTVITVRRADTGEVVRQFPNEEALTLLRRLNEQSGTFLDETV